MHTNRFVNIHGTNITLACHIFLENASIFEKLRAMYEIAQ